MFGLIPNGTKDIGNRCVDWSCSNLESGCCGGRLMVSVENRMDNSGEVQNTGLDIQTKT